MDYKKIYDQLIQRAKSRVSVGYIERHHIIPSCMGGDDTKENLVELYPEEHFVAHVLLLKIYKDTIYRYGLAKAVQNMTVSSRNHKEVRKRKLYGWLKREHALAMSKSQTGKGNSQFGTKWVCNIELRQNKKINKDEQVPIGWVFGRNRWEEKPKKKEKKGGEKRGKKKPRERKIYQCVTCGCELETRRSYCGKTCFPENYRKPPNTAGIGKSVSCDGMLFPTLTAAARHFNISVELVRLRTKSQKYDRWFCVGSQEKWKRNREG